jgi:hypothetical protein
MKTSTLILKYMIIENNLVTLHKLKFVDIVSGSFNSTISSKDEKNTGYVQAALDLLILFAKYGTTFII